MLGVWMVYPAVYTIIRSFFGQTGFIGHWVGIDNYKTLFTTSTLTTAIKNNVIWVAVVPALVTAIGLVFAVLTERIAWSTAFKTAVFMPMAISLFAAGVIWRIMDEKDPSRGTINAAIKVVDDAFGSGGVLTAGQASSPQLTGTPEQGFVLRNPVSAGETASLGLTAIPPDEVPADARQAVEPRAVEGSIAGVAWRD